MSTYLVAFIVGLCFHLAFFNDYRLISSIGEFDYVESYTKENVRVRVYTPLGQKEKGTFALDVASMFYVR